MNEPQNEDAPDPSAVELTFAIFHRTIAIVCMFVGLRYWAMLTGVSEEGVWRFDLLPTHWKTAAASLAVLWPVAATGLWMIVSWGPVIWLVAAMSEVVMYGFFSDLFGANRMGIVSHVAVAVLYGVFRAVLYFSRRVDG